MATAIAVFQPVWDCRWSQPGHRLTGVADRLQPEAEWTCVRDGVRRNVTEDECATCPHWEADAVLAASWAGARAAAPAAWAGAWAGTREAVPAEAVPAEAAPTAAAPAVIRWAYRGVMGAIALTFAATGIAILSSPLAVPLTVALWVCAGATVALAAITPDA